MNSAPKHDSVESNAWEALVKSSFVGLDRGAALDLSRFEPQQLLHQVSGKDKPADALRAAAIVRVHQWTGIVPSDCKATSLPACATDDWARCSPSAAICLSRILSGEFEFLLPEFLRVLVEVRQRTPEELLPALLDVGRRERDVISRFAPVLGHRGQWLARLNPDWGYVGSEITPADWETACKADRLLLLRAMRGKDPAAARQLLESTWNQEAVEDRAAFLGEFLKGLSREDEPFLENALDDRRKEVRQQAIELLVRLEGSALIERMKQRVIVLVKPRASASKLKRLLGGKPALDVTLPQACDEAMQRDGVEVKAKTGKGEKASWLQDMIATLPPRFWNEHLGCAAADCIRAAVSSDYKDSFLAGWATATARNPDAEWALALVMLALEDPTHSDLMSLAAHVSESEFGGVAVKLLKADRELCGGSHRGIQLLLRSQKPWSEEVARALFGLWRYQVRQAVAGKLTQVWGLVPSPNVFATSIPPSLADEFEQGWPEDAANQNFFKPILSLAQALKFRARMLKELSR